jgi:tetratricopeptide (TPR) repeat protein
LADKLLEFADRDHDIARELQQWRKANELGNDPADLKTLISEMLAPGRGFIAWDESASYVRRAEAVLPLLQRARARDAVAAAALCLHALRRAWGVLQQADDSNGEIGGLCQAIGAEWVLSLKAAGPQKAGFGDTYLQVQLDDPFGCFDAAAAEAAIGEPAMKRYRSATAERWRQAKDAVLALKAEHAAKIVNRKRRAPVYEKTSERDLSLWTLERLHLAQLEAAGQVDEALAVLREDMSDALAHSKVIDYLEGHGRFREAFAQAEQSCKVFPDDWRLQDDLVRCYERDGWTAEALAMRRQQFERRPGVERYQLVLKAGLAAVQDVVVLRQSLIDFLAGLELKAMNRPPYSARYGSAPVPTGERDVSLRGEVLCAEGRWSEACALVQPPAVCRDGVLSQIARHLAPEQGDQALSLLLRVFNSAMQRSSSPYRDELAMVEDIGRRMDPARRTAWLAQLRVEFKAKRNFIRDLPER